MTLSDFIEELNIAIQQDGHDIYCNAFTAKMVKRCLTKKKEGNMSEKEYALQILDEIRNRDGIGYNDYSDLWDAISEIPVKEETDG